MGGGIITHLPVNPSFIIFKKWEGGIITHLPVNPSFIIFKKWEGGIITQLPVNPSFILFKKWEEGIITHLPVNPSFILFKKWEGGNWVDQVCDIFKSILARKQFIFSLKNAIARSTPAKGLCDNGE